MKILHTSDWHLGRSLYGRKRYEEFSRFLDWLTETIKQEQVDILLVAGDIFDTSIPPNYAQELYYRFLHQVSTSHCQHVVIIAGNHDSPSFLTAPSALLQVLNVHVVGAALEDPRDEVFVLRDNADQPLAIVCAVPYLREKDIRSVAAGESVEAKGLKLVAGLQAHYEQVCDYAQQQQHALQRQGYSSLPLIAMGHLFTAGGKTLQEDGVRELYVGSLAYIGQDMFPQTIDYLALGHLHIPQCVGNNNHLRYSGSPLPMSFGEAGQDKQVIIADFKKGSVNIKEITIPRFQQLKQLSGNLDEIQSEIEALKQQAESVWLEIVYTGRDVVPDLWSQVEEMLADSKLEVLRIKNEAAYKGIVVPDGEGETLDDMDEYDVFKSCLQAHEIPEQSRKELMQSYKEIIHTLHEEDPNAL